MRIGSLCLFVLRSYIIAYWKSQLELNKYGVGWWMFSVVNYALEIGSAAIDLILFLLEEFEFVWINNPFEFELLIQFDFIHAGGY